MDHTKLQPSAASNSGSTVSNVIGSAESPASNIQQPQQRPRFNLNNFILVPTGNTNILTAANNGQIASNLIAANPNSLINKGKIMILTTAPTLANASGNTSGTTNAQILTAGHPGLRLLAPNTNSGIVTQLGNSNATATSIIANIKMNPASSNQATSSQIHQIASIQPSVATPGVTSSVVQRNTANFKPGTQTVHMLTPIVATTAPQLIPGANNRVVVGAGNQHLNLTSNRNQSIKSSSSKNGIDSPIATTNTASISTTPIILNSSNLFVTNVTADAAGNLNPTNQHIKTKPVINLNFLPNSSENGSGNNSHKDTSKEVDEEIQLINANDSLKCNEKLLLTDETLDRTSPELWPEAVPGLVKFLANTSPCYSSDEGSDESSDDCDNHITRGKSRADMQSSNNKRNESIDDSFDEFDDTMMDEDLDIDDDMIISNENNNSKCNNNTNTNNTNSTDNQSNRIVKSFSITSYGFELDHNNHNNNDQSALEENDIDDNESDDSMTNTSVDDNQVNKTSANQINNNKPEWQKEFDDEELSMIYGYGSLTAASLMDKINEIQNLAYQLGLEEESEITRARYLNILNEKVDGIAHIDHDQCSNLLIDTEIENIFKMSSNTVKSNESNVN